MFLYNSLTKKKEQFSPLRDNMVRIYFCGVTVQDSIHIGHLRGYVITDVLKRWLEYKGYKVKLIENFTDIDDKIIERAKRENIDYRIIAEKYIKEFFEVANALNLQPAYLYPRATQHIKEMIELIEMLIKKGLAYKGGPDIYFDVAKYPSYGSLSRKSIDDLRLGARIEPSPYKRNPLDFALWKGAKEGEPWWESPWGRGRPGWHIECSAMSTHYLGDNFDIHGGGEDLIFPHHENEIAQYEGATNKKFARFWMHTAMVNLTGEKMSKSTRHYIPVKEILKKYDQNALRLYLLKAHYQMPIDYKEERLKEAEEGWGKIKEFLSKARDMVLTVAAESPEEEFIQSLENNLNTPQAIASIFKLIQKGNALLAQKKREELTKVYAKLLLQLKILGFKEEKKREEIVEKLTDKLLEFRETLRQNKDYEKADKIREIMQECGIKIEDTKEGPKKIY